MTARDIDNMAGWLQSACSFSLTGVSTLNNRQGRILANDALSINAGQSQTDSPLSLFNRPSHNLLASFVPLGACQAAIRRSYFFTISYFSLYQSLKENLFLNSLNLECF
ncbi:hypothetical protein [Serratia symbiotica]|uniref:hypothetical protein n=1 Tax=Serratia symbiotica TaxID=138074 RepID=UPI0030CF9026